MRRLRAEGGSILPLVFGFFAVALVLVLVATAATSLYLERSRLYTLADGAALAGADAVVLGAIAVDGGDGAVEAVPQLGAAIVRGAASDYLDSATNGRRNPVALLAATSPDGRSARVRLAETWRPPIVTVFVPRGVRIEVEGSARPVIR